MVTIRWLVLLVALGCQSTALADGTEEFIETLLQQTARAEPSEKEFLEPKLYESFARLEQNDQCVEVPGLGAAVSQSQDPDIKDYVINVISDNDRRAIVRVRIDKLADETYELVKIGGNWKIYDICYSHTKVKNNCYRAVVTQFKCD